MAKVSITHAFTDGAIVTMTVETTTDYADSADDAVTRVLELYRQVVPDEAES
jgi:hypothetical protein